MFGVNLGVGKASRIASDILTASLLMRGNRIVNQCFDAIFIQELRQTVAIRAPDNE